MTRRPLGNTGRTAEDLVEEVEVILAVGQAQQRGALQQARTVNVPRDRFQEREDVPLTTCPRKLNLDVALSTLRKNLDLGYTTALSFMLQ